MDKEVGNSCCGTAGKSSPLAHKIDLKSFTTLILQSNINVTKANRNYPFIYTQTMYIYTHLKTHVQLSLFSLTSSLSMAGGLE